MFQRGSNRNKSYSIEHHYDIFLLSFVVVDELVVDLAGELELALIVHLALPLVVLPVPLTNRHPRDDQEPDDRLQVNKNDKLYGGRSGHFWVSN